VRPEREVATRPGNGGQNPEQSGQREHDGYIDKAVDQYA